MGDMGAVMALQQAERLVSTVARAFYTDTAVLVVDTLIREKYIKDKDDELASRLNLQPRQIRSVLAELRQEGLVSQEEMTDEQYSGRSSTYWFIDLRHAVNVIRLRVNEMQLVLHERQKAKVAQQTYVCPRCHEKFGVMEIQRLRNGDRSFCCSHCCDNDDHRNCRRSDYTLVDFHDSQGLEFVNALIALLDEQLKRSTDPSVPRQSIYELVSALRDAVVPNNLPSEQRAMGMGGQRRADVSSAHARFQDDFHRRSRAADRAAAEQKGRSSAKAIQRLYTKNWRGQDVLVEIEQSEEDEAEWEDDTDSDDAAGVVGAAQGLNGLLPSRSSIKRKAASEAARAEQAAKREKKTLPSFLQGSRISGGTENGGRPDDTDSDVDDVGESPQDTFLANGSVSLPHASRRLGAVAVNSVEERDEFKKRLLPWAERMKQAWRKQRQEMREQEAADSDAWWEDEDDEGQLSSHVASVPVTKLVGQEDLKNGSRDHFTVAGRTVLLEDLTPADAAMMSADEYTRFYNLSVSQ